MLAIKPAELQLAEFEAAELPGSEHPGVARNQAAILTHQRRRRPPPLLDARGYRGDLGIRVCPPLVDGRPLT